MTTNDMIEVRNFLNACKKVGIYDPVELIKSKVHVFDYLMGAFPRGILPTDVDGEVEINGNFLRFEYKKENQVDDFDNLIKSGQFRANTQLLNKGFTIFYVGQNSIWDPCCLRIFSRLSDGKNKINIDKHGLWRKCNQWARRADPKWAAQQE